MAHFKSAKKFHRAVRAMARQLAEAHGGIATLEHGGCHAKIVVTLKGKSRGLAVAISPRKEETGLWNTEKQLKKMIAEMLK